MRLTREKSYNDLEYGHEECWKVYDASEAKATKMADTLTDNGFEQVDGCTEDGDGYAAEFILDKNDVERFKRIYKASK